MPLPITLTTAAALALVNTWLAFRIVRLRMRDKVLLGDGGDPLLHARTRAQANLVEYAPFALALVLAIELARGPGVLLWVLALLFVAARIAHPIGMDTAGSNPLRAAGALVTWVVTLVLAGWALGIAYQAVETTPLRTLPGEVTTAPA